MYFYTYEYFTAIAICSGNLYADNNIAAEAIACERCTMLGHKFRRLTSRSIA